LSLESRLYFHDGQFVDTTTITKQYIVKLKNIREKIKNVDAANFDKYLDAVTQAIFVEFNIQQYELRSNTLEEIVRDGDHLLIFSETPQFSSGGYWERSSDVQKFIYSDFAALFRKVDFGHAL
jgi:hypothetical protein